MIIVDETDPLEDLEAPFEPRQVELRHDEEVRDYFDMKKEIGRGRFGTVYLCNCRKTGVKFAAKFINTKRKLERRNVEREIEIMKTLHEKKPCLKLIQLYDAFDMKTEMALILEIVDGGELFERVINDDFVLTEKACVVIVKQICMAVEYIHSKNILHLDMKPENILCLSWAGNRVKICDFGLARKYDPRKKLQVLFGTPEFVAPEVVNFEPISFGTDMWSVGVICYVLLSGLSPFMGHNFVETMTNVTKNQYDFDDEAFDDVSDQAINFIKSLLILDKSERLTSTQCLRHDWIRKPLQPSTRARRRRSTTVSSDEESSDENDQALEVASRTLDASNDKDDDGVFATPTKTETDECKKRKISEDVLEKNNTVSEKKRKDDDSLSDKKEAAENAEEKMSTSSLNTSMMTEQDSSADKTDENISCGNSQISNAFNAKEMEIPVALASNASNKEDKISGKIITESQIRDDPMSGSNTRSFSEVQKISEQTPSFSVKDSHPDINSVKPCIPQTINEGILAPPKMNDGTHAKIISNSAEKKEVPPPVPKIREIPIVTSNIDRKDIVTKETETTTSIHKQNNTQQTLVGNKAALQTPPTETHKEQKNVEQKTPCLITEAPKVSTQDIQKKQVSAEQKSPPVVKDALKSSMIEIKSQPKSNTPETKPETKVIQNKEPDKPSIRRRETPITIERHEVSKPVVRKREIPMTTETIPPARKRETQAPERKKVEDKTETKGRIIPITLEQDNEQPPIRKREVPVTVSTTDDSRQRQRQREVPVPCGTATKAESSVSERRREIPIVKKESVVATDTQSGTASRGNERKRDTPAGNSKEKEDEPKSNAKRDLSSDELELERTKKQLKEFVERWNSHPDSPYVIGTPILPHEIERSTKPDGWNSRASLASVAVAPPSIHEEEELSDVEMVDIGAKEEFIHYVFDQPHPIVNNKPEIIAKQLEQKLNILKEAEKKERSPTAGTTNATQDRSNSTMTRTRVRNADEPRKRPEIEVLQRDEPRIRRRSSAAADSEHGHNRSRTNSSSTTKMPPGRDVPLAIATSPTDIAKKVEDISISDRRDSSPARRQRPSGRHRPGRDMPTKPNKDGLVSIPIAYEPQKEHKKSRSNTPTRRGRKSSREERNPSKANSRAHSKESNHSLTGKGHRRPSRDAPMTSAQTERLGFLNISGCEASEGAQADILWPDMRVVPQNADCDFDDDDDDSEATLLEPVTFKLELGVSKAEKNADHSPIKTQPTNASSFNDTIQKSPSTIPTNTSKTNIFFQPPVSSGKTSTASVTPQSIASPSDKPMSNATLASPVSTTGKMSTVTSLPVSNIPLDTKTTNSNLQNSRNTPCPPSLAPLSKPNSVNKVENESQTKQNANETSYVSENKLVAWIMDIGTHQKKLPLSGSTTDLVSHFEGHEVTTPNRLDREKSPRTRDRSPMPADRNREKTVTAPKPPFGCPLAREKSCGSLNLSDSPDIIQTPWGTLKRSSSRNSINKSPPKNSVNSSPTSTALLRTTSSEIPLIKLEEEMDTSHNNGKLAVNNRNSFSSFDNSTAKPSSRSPSPRSFKPYNTKSLTTKNLSEIASSPISRPISPIKPTRSSSTLNKEVERSPSPPSSRPPIPSPTLRPNRLSLETKLENSSRNGPITQPDREAQMSSFDKKVSKQTSLEVLNPVDKQESQSSRVSSNGLDKSPSDVKFNTLPRPTSSNKESSPCSSRSSSKPPSGDSKRNSVEIPPGERRKSRTLPGVPMPPRKQFSFLLFSAHDRISEFEKKDDKPTTRTQRPITRSKTSTSFTDENTKSRGHSPLQVSPSLSDKQLRDDKKNSIRPSVVSSNYFPRSRLV